MDLVDTHCHLQMPAFDADREDVLARAFDCLKWIVLIGDDVANSQAGVALVRERVYATVAIHPHHAVDVNGEALAILRELAMRPGVVALGEIGLDYHYEFSPRERQKEALRAQLELAADLRLPVVFHCREAEEDFSEIVGRCHTRLAGGIMHCFGGNAAFAEQCLGWGFYISFAGNVTYPKAEKLREAAKVVPLDRLLVETDSPYLSPQCVRSKRRCEPAYVVHTAEFLAGLKGVPIEELARHTTDNGERIYRLDSGRTRTHADTHGLGLTNGITWG